MPLSLDLSGRVALVTGAARGIGFAIARGLARAGALTVLNGRDAKALAAARTSIEGDGGRTDAAVFDVADRDAVRAAIADLEARHGAIDIVVNNAGIQRRHPVTEFPLDEWDAIIATNLTAPFLVAQAALTGMKARGRGVIINIASLMSELGRPTIVPYTAAKGGVRQLTRGLATELGPTGIRVNAIAPGYILTEMNREFFESEAGQAVMKRVPQRRIGTPRDLDGALLLLVSDAGAFMTGAVVVVDGGHVVNSL
jgi:gluconate 5-dehydrogenase